MVVLMAPDCVVDRLPSMLRMFPPSETCMDGENTSLILPFDVSAESRTLHFMISTVSDAVTPVSLFTWLRNASKKVVFIGKLIVKLARLVSLLKVVIGMSVKSFDQSLVCICASSVYVPWMVAGWLARKLYVYDALTWSIIFLK